MHMPALAICPNYIYTTQASVNFPGEFGGWNIPGSPDFNMHIEVCRQQANGSFEGDIDAVPNFYGNHLYTELWERSIFPIDTFLVRCRWQRTNFELDPCSDFFETVTTNYGVCYQLKNFENFTVVQAGQDFGLNLLLDLNQPNVTSAETSDGAGVQVVLFERGMQMPLERQNSYSLSPGFEHYIALEQHVTKRLSKPYNDLACEDDESYSQGICLDQCFRDAAWKNCDCYDAATGRTDNCTLCSFFVPCVDHEAPEFYRGDCNCSLACNEVHYKATVTSLTLPSEYRRAQINALLPHYDDDATLVSQNALQLYIYFNSLIVTHTEEKPALSVTQVVSDLGGSLGLCIGASVVTIFEFIEFCGSLIVKRAKRNQGRLFSARRVSVKPIDLETR